MSKISQKTVYICMVLIITIGALLRFYNSYSNLRFLDDESGIISIVQKLGQGLSSLNLSNFPLKGQAAETFFPGFGSYLHHGAFFYYLIYLPALVTNFHPYGLTFFIIILNIAAIYLMYGCGEILFGRVGGLISALLLATSSLATAYSRWIWNPNLIVFFITLSLLAFLKIAKGHLKYWPIFTFAAASATQMHILGHIFIFMTFGPLLFFIKYPKNKLLLLTVIAFLLPLAPEIFSELTSGFQFSKNILHLFSMHASDYFDFFKFANLIKIALLNLLGTGGQQLDRLLVLSLTGVILLLAIKSPNLNINLLRKAFLNIYKLMFITGGMATGLVILFSRQHLERGPNHTLLICLPITILFFTLILKSILSNKFVFPIALVLISIYLHSNLTMTITQTWYLKVPTFPDQLLLAKYLDGQVPQSSKVYILPQMIVYSLPWISSNFTKNQNIVFVSVDSSPRLMVVDGYSQVKRDPTICPNRRLEKDFNSILLYKCL